MIKNSSQIREIRESCRWCDGSILSFGEWTYEGSLKGNRVGADGDLARYPAESHGCAIGEGVIADD